MNKEICFHHNAQIKAVFDHEIDWQNFVKLTSKHPTYYVGQRYRPTTCHGDTGSYPIIRLVYLFFVTYVLSNSNEYKLKLYSAKTLFHTASFVN